MVIIILERVPSSLRGELTRWMIEPKAGVFIGCLSARVRDKLWDKVRKKAESGAGIMVFNSNNEQGFEVRPLGDASREIIDCEGLTLVRIPTK